MEATTKTIPIPERWPFSTLKKVGASFPIPTDKVNTVRIAAWRERKRSPERTFSVLKQWDGSYRCWRVA